MRLARLALGTWDRITTGARGPVSSRRKKAAAAITLLACLLAPLPALAQKPIMVDDDWRQFPGGLPTIQQAISLATAGDTILVFPGEYLGTVNIIGHEKDGLKIIAVGGPEEVVLQGDHTQRDGFHLEDVNNVLIQGFTIRDFGSRSQTATISGVGNNILLLRANHNTISHNRSTQSDMMAITLSDSADNLVEDNLIWNNDPTKWGECGIHMQGSGSTRNVIRRNHISGSTWGGIMISSAGIDNQVLENVVSSNGAIGITHTGTNGTRIEGNLSNQNLGRFAGPNQSPLGHGIYIASSTGLTVKENSAFQNTGFDFYWDNTGNNKFIDNPGLESLSALRLSNSSNAARNLGFLVGDSFRLEVNDAPANAPVYLRLFKNAKDLGVTGPYGSITDSQGRWLLTGTYDSSAVGSWFVQALFGSPESSNRTGVIGVTVR